MLWVNIIMDTLGGLAFAGEPALNYYMLERPKRREEPIISRRMLSQVLLNGAYTLALLIFFLSYRGFRNYFTSLPRLLTAFYALFIFCGIVNSFTARSERMFIFSGLLKNKAFILIMSFITMIQILIVYFGGALFRSTPLTLKELSTVALLAFSVFIFDSIRRIFAKLK
jgi:magnesium-transporting ATPase (P-type)